jgi:hypothetical protein
MRFIFLHREQRGEGTRKGNAPPIRTNRRDCVYGRGIPLRVPWFLQKHDVHPQRSNAVMLTFCIREASEYIISPGFSRQSLRPLITGLQADARAVQNHFERADNDDWYKDES